jgi:hypothetical protein
VDGQLKLKNVDEQPFDNKVVEFDKENNNINKIEQKIV